MGLKELSLKLAECDKHENKKQIDEAVQCPSVDY